MTTLSLGEVTLTRVIEIGRSSFPTTSMLPESTAEGVARHHAWLKPEFWDETTDDLGSRIGTWIVRTPEHLVLIDTGVGNDKIARATRSGTAGPARFSTTSPPPASSLSRSITW